MSIGKFNIKSGLILGLLFFVIFSFIQIFPSNPKASFTFSVALLMAVWWMTEAIPLPITSLLPVVLFSAFGILSGKSVAESYFNNTIMLFLGGFLLAIAFEKWNLHKRVALTLISKIGTKPSMIILSFMIVSAFLSMFISNTATAVMLLPIGLAVINQIENKFGYYSKSFDTALLLAIAYSCSLGGIATLIGTPPNLVFHRIYSITFPEAPQITFAKWLLFGLPLSILMLLIVWLLLTKIIFKDLNKLNIDKSIILKEYKLVGKPSFEEKVIFLFFLIAVLMWIFRVDINFGSFNIPGWSNIFSKPEFIDDSTIAIAIALILFLIPSKSNKGSFILEERELIKVPWGVLLLFGGGFALAQGFQDSGLSNLLCNELMVVKEMPEIFLLTIITGAITFLTELTSNTAVANTILPIVAVLAKASEINPLMLMVPVTIASSFAFMLPVATPPNAIVFGTGKIKIREMVKVGFILNIIAIIVISIYFKFFSTLFF